MKETIVSVLDLHDGVTEKELSERLVFLVQMAILISRVVILGSLYN